MGSEDTSGMDRRAPICPPPQAFIFLGKDPSLEILQQEGGTLAHWSGQASCCGVRGRLSVQREQDLGPSSWWEDASSFPPFPFFPLSPPDQQSARAGKWSFTRCHAPPYPSVQFCHWRSPAYDLLREHRLLKSPY